MSDTKEFIKEIQLTSYEALILNKPVRGRGNIQSLIRKLQLQLSYNNKLKLTQKDIDAIFHYHNKPTTRTTVIAYHSTMPEGYYKARLDVVATYLEAQAHTIKLED